MLVGVDSHLNIEVYLETDELGRLSSGIIEGMLFRLNEKKGSVTLSVNNTRSFEHGYGIGVSQINYSQQPCLEVFLGTGWYQELIERGVIGSRHQLRDASKITVYDSSRINGMESLRLDALLSYVQRG